MSSGRCEMLNSNFTRPLLQTPIHGVKAQEKKFKPWEKWVYQLRKRILVTLSANTSSKIGSKQRECLMRPVPVVSARGRKPWLAAHWSIVWVCIGSDFPGHEIRSWVILKMSCYFKLFFNFMFDMSSHIYLGKLCFIRTPTVQPSPHSWCWGGCSGWEQALLWGHLHCQALFSGTDTTLFGFWEKKCLYMAVSTCFFI